MSHLPEPTTVPKKSTTPKPSVVSWGPLFLIAAVAAIFLICQPGKDKETAVTMTNRQNMVNKAANIILGCGDTTQTQSARIEKPLPQETPPGTPANAEAAHITHQRAVENTDQIWRSCNLNFEQWQACKDEDAADFVERWRAGMYWTALWPKTSVEKRARHDLAVKIAFLAQGENLNGRTVETVLESLNFSHSNQTQSTWIEKPLSQEIPPGTPAHVEVAHTTRFRRLPSKVAGVQMTVFWVTVLPGDCWTDKLVRPAEAKSYAIRELSASITEYVTYLDPALPAETLVGRPDIELKFKGKVGSVSFRNESRESVSFKIHITY